MGHDRTLLLHLATSRRLERAVRATPGAERAAWRAAHRYVAGETRADAIRTAGTLIASGHSVSIDRFGEHVEDAAEADRVTGEYLALAAAIDAPGNPLCEPSADRTWLSVDLTHLAVATDPAGAAGRLEAIARALPEGRRVQVGAEDARHADAIQGCVLEVAGRGLGDRLGATVQANLHRSVADVARLAEAGIHVRLVKGAYVERSGAHPFGEPTDIAFLRLSQRLAETGTPWSMATHDGRMREALLMSGAGTAVEHLLGVRADVLDELHARGVATRVYVPYGPDWFRYWARRVAESRGA
jgi:proline dehydrogenase